ncbi:MAG: DMT family transporter [Actinomycetota bacterium]
MPLLLALAAAAMWGAGDFMGGIAARLWSAFRVAFVGQLIGLALVVAALPFLPGEAIRADLLWGAAAGVFGGLGALFLYRGLAEGQMNVVAPITAVTAAVLPAGAGLALGETPEPAASAGVALAIGAVALLGMQQHPHSEDEAAPTGRILSPRGLGTALVAGIGFGLFFTLIAQTSVESGLWPLLSNRLVSCTILGAILVVWSLRRNSPEGKGGAWLATASGTLDMTANVAYLLAAQRGSLALVAVLASLYPAGTVLLSRFVLKEPLGKLHAAGLVLALIAIVLITGYGA